MPSPAPLAGPAERAFPAHPAADRYFAASSIEECRQRLVRVVQRGDGPALVIGAPGMGKSMLMAVLAESLGDGFQVVLIHSTQLCTRRALLQAILFGLGLPYQDRDEGELRLALAGRLVGDSAGDARPVALLIDEAQALPTRLLEELRVMTNVTRADEPMVRLVLAGAQGLEEQLASTELESLNQRLAARCYLAPLGYAETHQYVRAHVAAAGGDPDRMVTTAALDCLYSATDGVPRLINQLCDRALVMAVEAGSHTVDEPIVQRAWSDLHQLPAPWHTPEAALPAPESGVVEFGVLPEEAEQVAEHVAAVVAAAEPTGAAPADDAAAENSEGPAAPVHAVPSASVWNADDALSEITAGSGVVGGPGPRSTEPAAPIAASQTPATQTLFGDGFDDEEVVIDRFAALESAFSTATPAVINRQEPAINLPLPIAPGPLGVSDTATPSEPLVAEPAAEEEEEQAAATPMAETPPPAPAEPETADVLPLAAARWEVGVPSDPSADDPGRATPSLARDEAPDEGDVLVIEPDAARAATPPPGARREEYRQLFANLRRRSESDELPGPEDG